MAQVHAACLVVLLVSVSATSCATAASTTRELPTGLRSSLGSLLENCEPDGENTVARRRCRDGVMVASRTRTVGVDEAMYRAEAYSMAQIAGGRLVWDQVSVTTQGASDLVDRARALLPGTDVPSATLVGVVRSVDKSNIEEIWCTSTDSAGAVRCEQLIGVALAAPVDRASPKRASRTPNTALPDVVPRPAAKGAPVALFGRSLSLPTTCAAKMVADGGDATCNDGATMSWRRFDDMDEATNIVHETLAALGDASDGQAYPCTIAGEAAGCAEHPRAAAGLAYVDGKPVAVLCLGVAGARAHSLCTAVMVPAAAVR